MPGRGRHSQAVTLPLRPRNNTISYREPSSEVDTDVEGSESTHTRPTLRSSRKRRRISYNEESSGTDGEVENDEQETRAVAGQGNRRRAQKEPSSTQVNGASRPRRPMSWKPMPSFGAKRVKNMSNNVTANQTKEQDFDIRQLGGKIPLWQTLPYEILFQIFQYASYPLITDTFEPEGSISWLYQSALLGKGFAEPALSALYYAPPLCPPSRVYKLLSSLLSQNQGSFLNYRAKVKYLDLEAIQILGLKHEGREPIELADIVSLTTQLRGIGIHLLSDLPSWHSPTGSFPQAQGKRKAYQSSLFPALNDSNIRLNEWIWNAKLAARSQLNFNRFEDFHRSSAFQTLKSLTFVNSHHLGDMEQFARSASVLPNLQNLTIKNMVLEELQYLKLLPRNLEYLAVVNCPLIESSVLAPLLQSHGSNLKEMVLDHNNSLNLAFLQQLASSCPKLERLRMDLRFYNTHFTFRDSDPKFRDLLTDEMVPAWPRTLQRIELFHLRKWDTGAAHTFFSSLVDSAGQLPDLRYLDIKASIGESNWRDRISFRNKWTSRMEKVFRRVSAPPDPHLKSIRVFMKHRKEFRSITGAEQGSLKVKVERRNTFSHVEVPSCASANTSDSDMPLASKRRSNRLRHRSDDQITDRRPLNQSRKRRKRRRNAEYNSSTEEDSALEDLNINEDSQHTVNDDDDEDMYMQGMCDVVRVAIDNLRPTEEHLDESYFLDDELSGDEDWNGDDDVRGGGGYAW
ncbi:MAG: hypothetical protein Q9166_006241 [cf. Caloplaca sp. 2 TL-2023]